MSTFFKRIAAATLASTALLGAGATHAALLLGQEPDPSLIVRVGNYEWVYASPCGADAIVSCSAIELHHGFRLATVDEWNRSFTSLEALDAAFTVGDEARCAASYFSVEYDECQIWDMRYGYVWGAPFGNGFGDYSAETFLVRTVDSSDVPEPATLALLGLGLLGVAAGRRRA